MNKACEKPLDVTGVCARIGPEVESMRDQKRPGTAKRGRQVILRLSQTSLIGTQLEAPGGEVPASKEDFMSQSWDTQH